MFAREKAPVFVVGSARSGNTLLYHMFLSSGQFPIYRTEPVVFDVLVPRFGDLSILKNRSRLIGYWLRSKQFRLSGLDSRQITDRVLLEVRTGGDFLRIAMDAIAQAQGFQRWAVWGPDNLLYIPTIKRQIPEAIFIHVIRDGRDVAVALDKRKFIRPFPWDRDKSLLIAGLHWMWKVRTGRRHGQALGADYVEASFEKLVTEPQETLAHLSQFIGQTLDYGCILRAEIGALREPNSSFAEELQAGQFAPVGRWKRVLSQQQIASLEALIGELLLELGYTMSTSNGGGRGDLNSRILKTLYPGLFTFKEWLKTRTLLGRLVNTDRLLLQDGTAPTRQIDAPSVK